MPQVYNHHIFISWLTVAVFRTCMLVGTDTSTLHLKVHDYNNFFPAEMYMWYVH